MHPVFRFHEFTLDASNRRLLRGEAQLDLSARYFDALVLLVREHGQLIGKDRFFEEVWHDVVVSDAALSQCIKEIRRLLGDDASQPRFVETVPRHGYRFIADVVMLTSPDVEKGTVPAHEDGWRTVLADVAAGTLGGALAGVFGGFLYGLGLAQPTGGEGLGTLSVLLVMIGLNVVVGLLGGFGISAGMAVAEWAGKGQRRWWIIPGAALGGMFVGGTAKLLGVDAFTLLLGITPAGITGGVEGAVLGATIGAGLYVAGGLNAVDVKRPVLGAATGGFVAGVAIPLAGGNLMGGSLLLLAQQAATTRLPPDLVSFGNQALVVLGGLEGLLFGAGVAGALVLGRTMRQK